jgi:hypothetical protein
MIRSPYRLLVLLAASLAAIALASPALAAPARAAAPYCGISWGSLAEQGPSGTDPAAGQTLTDVRAGRHACYDRLVLDIRGAVPSSWRVEYVPRMTEDPSGRAMSLRGGAVLQIVVGASAYDAAGRATYTPGNRGELVDVRSFRTFRQVAEAGSFEGLTTVGLGVRAHLPFRVFTLSGTSGSTSGARVVVDVAHRW